MKNETEVPKATKSPEKDLSSIGETAWNRSADSNRGNCPKPDGWYQGQKPHCKGKK